MKGKSEGAAAGVAAVRARRNPAPKFLCDGRATQFFEPRDRSGAGDSDPCDRGLRDRFGAVTVTSTAAARARICQ